MLAYGKMEPSILKRALRKLRLTNEKLFPISQFEIAEREIHLSMRLFKGLISRGTDVILRQTQNLTRKCKLKKTPNKRC